MGVNSKLSKTLVRNVDPFLCVQGIVDAYRQYQEIAEQERTKRRNIEAWEKTTIEEIRSKREILTIYLECSFDERAENFQRLFNLVDQAIASNNNQQLTMLMDNILEIAKSSPFKDLSSLDSVQKSLDDPDHCWEF